MLKRLILTLTLLTLILAGGSCSQQEGRAAGISSALSEVEPVEQTVYITRTGAKYHRSSCQYLRQSKISIKKSEARAQGYDPCKVCRP